MKKRIFISIFAVEVVSVLIVTVSILTVFYLHIFRREIDSLRADAEIIAASLESAGSETLVSALSGVGGMQVTVVDSDDVGFASFPEAVEALEHGSSFGGRGLGTLYIYALRLDDGSILHVSKTGGGFIASGAAALVSCVIITAAAAFVSMGLTRRITEPVRMLAENGGGEGFCVYPELCSIDEKIRSQQIEIKRQLARVEKEKNRLSTIINNMDEGLFILDNNLHIITLNESACRLLNSTLPRSECAGRTIEEVCSMPEVRECIERADSLNLSLDGRHLQLHVNYVVSSAEQVGRIGLILDITERTEIERIKQEFTANVSHELKTPLTSISGYAELIESGMAAGDDAVLFAGRIRRESGRMLTLISDIIKLSQLDEESDGEGFEPVELYTLCGECLDILEIAAERHNVTLSLEGERCELLGSVSELSELVYNLIDNAIRYNRPGGKVAVRITLNPAGYSGGAVAMLSVSDTGIGIEKEHAGRVFERFYRVDKSRSKATGGTGLGLAIVKHVAERHGAKLELDSRIGIGTTARVIFYDNVSENL